MPIRIFGSWNSTITKDTNILNTVWYFLKKLVLLYQDWLKVYSWSLISIYSMSSAVSKTMPPKSHIARKVVVLETDAHAVLTLRMSFVWWKWYWSLAQVRTSSLTPFRMTIEVIQIGVQPYDLSARRRYRARLAVSQTKTTTCRNLTVKTSMS